MQRGLARELPFLGSPPSTAKANGSAGSRGSLARPGPRGDWGANLWWAQVLRVSRQVQVPGLWTWPRGLHLRSGIRPNDHAPPPDRVAIG